MSKYHFVEPFPWAHQKRAIKKMLSREGNGFLDMEMRTGKSRVAIDTACVLNAKGRVKRVLIFCPFSSMGVWRREINKYAPPIYKDAIEWQVLNYENAFSRASFQEDELDGLGLGSLRSYVKVHKLVIDGYERMNVAKLTKAIHDLGKGYRRTWVAVNNESLDKFKPDMLICDESHIVANTSSVTHRKVYRLAKTTPHVLLLTGTPGEPEKIFGQFRLLDEAVFGSSLSGFQAEYCEMGGYMNKQVKGYRNEDKFRDRIAPYMFQCREADAWEVPKMTDEIVPVTLNESLDAYTQMNLEAVVALKNDDEPVIASIVLTQLLRLSQITSGHLPNAAGKPKRIGHEKEKVYRGLIRQLKQNDHTKIVTFCRFLPDIAVCARAALAEGFDIFLLHGGVARNVRDQRIADFDEITTPAIFIAQTRTASMSVDLSSARDTIYYSLDYSLTTYEQSRSRIRGHRQRGKHLTYWHLLAEGTVDEVAYLALHQKQEVIKFFLRHPKLLERTT